MGQICPVLVFVSFTLKSVTKLNSVKHLRSRTHLDTVVRAPAYGDAVLASSTSCSRRPALQLPSEGPPMFLK